MFVSWKHALILLMAATMWESAQGSYNVTEYCTMVKSGTKLPSIESCQTFYVCQTNGDYTEGSCSSDMSFDKNKQDCVPSSETKCYYGLDNPCDGTAAGHVPQPNSCDGWIYCKDNQEIGRGNCPTGTIFNDGKCIYGTCSDESTEETIVQVCDIMQTGVYFGSTSDCAEYQICKDGDTEPTSGTCENLMYDVELGLCNYKESTDCSRVVEEDKSGTTCTGEEKKPNEKVCSAYYKCNNEKFESKSCETGEYFDIFTKECVLRQEARPTPNCDRCEGSKKQFVNSVDLTCSGYLICSNGVSEGNNTCGVEYYFDEQAQGCVKVSTETKSEYIENNGACQRCLCSECPIDSTDCYCGLDPDNTTTCTKCEDDSIKTNGVCCNCSARGSEEECVEADGCNCKWDDTTPTCSPPPE